MSIQQLKKQSAVDKLKRAVAQSQAGTFKKGEDTRFWKPEIDKAGNGFAVIRFLDTPKVDGEDNLPWVQIWSHGFKGPGGWYIENSLTTLGQNDPVSEYNTVLWNSGVEENKKKARDQKRKLSYISNILVVNDPKHPENNGKVFLFKYGKMIFDMIKEKMEPTFQDETALYPFDFWAGANFKLKIRTESDFIKYDKSEFEAASPIAGTDKEIEKIWNSAYSLQEFLKPENFKSYDDLKKRLDKVLGKTEDYTSVATAGTKTRVISDDAPSTKTKTASKAEDVTAEDDDAMAYYEKLANGG